MNVINKGNFKEMFTVMCESNDRLPELFKKGKKNATLISKTIQDELQSFVRNYSLECINKDINK